MAKTTATFAQNQLDSSIAEEANESEENRASLTWDNLQDIRVRVKNYGKWYLPPDNFNRNFDNLKNVVTPDQIEQVLIKRIKEVKDSYKRDIPNPNTFQAGVATHPRNIGDMVASGGSNETQVKKKSGVEQEREILNNLQAIADSLKQKKKRSTYKPNLV